MPPFSGMVSSFIGAPRPFFKPFLKKKPKIICTIKMY